MNSDQKFTTGISPDDVINTPTGAMVEVPGDDGTIRLVPLSDIMDPNLAGQGWDINPDLEADALVSPEGHYHAGPNAN